MSLRAGVNWQVLLVPRAVWVVRPHLLQPGPHLGTGEAPNPGKSETLGVGPSGLVNKPFR